MEEESLARGRRVSRIRASLTPLVGRRREILAAVAAIEQDRLVSLVGVGGVGKSRLAEAVAHELGGQFRDGVVYVELATVQDPQHIPQVVHDLVDPVSNPRTSLIERLYRRHMLLVLDACEHLISDIAGFATELLEYCPDVRIIVTSRIPLGIMGERVFHVPPLSVAPSSDTTPSEAALLFMHRARAVTSDTIGDDPVSIEELCRRLDGLPLAIELAAIRLRTMSVRDMLASINDRFALLRAGPAEGAARSLSAMLRWSWEQCDDAQRRLWTEMSIFVGAVRLPEIAAVCKFDDILAAADAVDGLVQRSLVVRELSESGTTFRMLDTITEFGREMIDSHDYSWDTTRDELRARHAYYFSKLAEGVGADWFGPHQIELSRHLRTAMPNLRLAFDYLMSDEVSAGTAANVFVNLWPYWIGCGHLREARMWANRILDRTGERVPDFLWVSGWVEILLGDLETAEAFFSESIASSPASSRGQYIAHSLLGACRGIRGDYSAAATAYDYGIKEAVAADDVFATALLTQNYAEIATIGGDVEHGMYGCDRVAAICREHNERWILSHVLWVQALGDLITGDLAGAVALSSESLRLKSSIYDLLGVALAAEVFAWASAKQGELRTAATVLGATAAYWSDTDRELMGFTQLSRYREECVQSLTSGLSVTVQQSCGRRGAELGLEGIANLPDRAEQHRSSSASGSSSPTTRVLLTQREREIVEHVSAGLSNKQIAGTLVVSVRTVETHVSHILAKLGVTRRTELKSVYRPAKNPDRW